MRQTTLGTGWYRESKRHSEAAKKGAGKKKEKFVKESLTAEISDLTRKIQGIYDGATMFALQVIEKGGTRKEADAVYKSHIRKAKPLEKKRDGLRKRLWIYNAKVEKEKLNKETKKQGDYRQQRDRLTHVLDIIRELEREMNAPVLKSEIVEKGVVSGLTEDEVVECIECLKLDGNIYDPNRDNRYKLV